jgi:AcrR family transcriptional regulator
MADAKQKSASVSQRRDSARKDERIRRTRARIDAAFIDLLHRRAYGNIRVSDITKKAGVGRATFYAHYETKDELLRSQFDRMVAPMFLSAPAQACRIDATFFFEHMRTAPELYRTFMGPEGGTAPRVLRDCFEDRFRRLLQPGGAVASVASRQLQESALARFVASSLITIIECWLEQGARETSPQVQLFFSELVGPGVAAALAKSNA